MTDKPVQLHTAAEIDMELEVVDFVAGRMDADSSAEFEARMEADPELAARVAEERALNQDIVDSVPGEVPPAAAFESIRPEVEAQRRAPVWLPAAIAAGVIAVALLFAIPGIDGPPVGEEPLFETLSGDPAQAVPSDTRVRVVFSEGSTETERAAAGERLGFEIVSGPGAGGSWMVESEVVVDREQLIEWRADDVIELAEPIVYSTDP